MRARYRRIDCLVRRWSSRDAGAGLAVEDQKDDIGLAAMDDVLAAYDRDPMPIRPPIQVCQLCAIDDFVVLESTAPDLWQFRCACGPQHPDRDHVWAPTPAVQFEPGRTGVGEELGVYDDLLRCVEANERVEYGVVEHRFAQISPASYRELLSRYGHTSIGPTRYSTSSFLSHALAQLYREGLLARSDVPATGYWQYLRIVPSFARPETNQDIETTSWAAYATRHSIDPETWPSTT